MRIVAFDDLTERQQLDRALLTMAAFGAAVPREHLEAERRRPGFVADYVAVFAVEEGRAVGQVYVVRFPYAFRDGVEVVSGLAGVATRADRRRAGVARALLEEVHARERSAGLRHVTLWTNHSWGAHALYERMGYRDIYSAPWAVHAPGGRRRRRGAPSGRDAVRVRWGRRSDLGAIERVYVREAEHRLGFRRVPGHLPLAVETRRLDPPKQLLVARRGSETVGYAQVDRSPFRTVCGELVADSGVVRRALADAVARAAGGGVYAFQHTPVSDHPELFGTAGYSTAPRSWWGLMARGPDAAWSEQEARHRFVTDDPRFLCLSGDRF